MKRNALCKSYMYSLRVANAHKIKVFRKLDAENQAIDQMDLFNETNKIKKV